MEQNKMIELPIDVVKEMSILLETLIDSEIESKTTFKHKFIDEKGKEVSNPTPKQISDKGLKKIFDVQRTIFEPKIETTISEKGIKYTKLKYFLDGNIQKFEIEKSKETADTEVSKD